jgi:hypothetical protein
MLEGIPQQVDLSAEDLGVPETFIEELPDTLDTNVESELPIAMQEYLRDQRNSQEEQKKIEAHLSAGENELQQRLGGAELTTGDTYMVRIRETHDGRFLMNYNGTWNEVAGSLNTGAYIEQLEGGKVVHEGDKKNGGTVEVLLGKQPIAEGFEYIIGSQEFIAEEVVDFDPEDSYAPDNFDGADIELPIDDELEVKQAELQSLKEQSESAQRQEGFLITYGQEKPLVVLQRDWLESVRTEEKGDSNTSPETLIKSTYIENLLELTQSEEIYTNVLAVEDRYPLTRETKGVWSAQESQLNISLPREKEIPSAPESLHEIITEGVEMRLESDSIEDTAAQQPIEIHSKNNVQAELILTQEPPTINETEEVIETDHIKTQNVPEMNINEPIALTDDSNIEQMVTNEQNLTPVSNESETNSMAQAAESFSERFPLTRGIEGVLSSEGKIQQQIIQEHELAIVKPITHAEVAHLPVVEQPTVIEVFHTAAQPEAHVAPVEVPLQEFFVDAPAIIEKLQTFITSGESHAEIVLVGETTPTGEALDATVLTMETVGEARQITYEFRAAPAPAARQSESVIRESYEAYQWIALAAEAGERELTPREITVGAAPAAPEVTPVQTILRFETELTRPWPPSSLFIDPDDADDSDTAPEQPATASIERAVT